MKVIPSRELGYFSNQLLPLCCVLSEVSLHLLIISKGALLNNKYTLIGSKNDFEKAKSLNVENVYKCFELTTTNYNNRDMNILCLLICFEILGLFYRSSINCIVIVKHFVNYCSYICYCFSC